MRRETSELLTLTFSEKERNYRECYTKGNEVAGVLANGLAQANTEASAGEKTNIVSEGETIEKWNTEVPSLLRVRKKKPKVGEGGEEFPNRKKGEAQEKQSRHRGKTDS